MASNGIKDKVAIISMGCTPFREHWDKSADDLLIDATTQTLESASLTSDDIDAYWVGTAQSGMSGLTLSMPMKLRGNQLLELKIIARQVQKLFGKHAMQ